jgi:dipeptide/tripeptide permease
MVGGLYGQGDIRDKDIFYIGINTGLTFGNYGDWFRGCKMGWHAGFGLAGIAMVLGLIVYLWGQKISSSCREFCETRLLIKSKVLMDNFLVIY